MVIVDMGSRTKKNLDLPRERKVTSTLRILKPFRGANLRSFQLVLVGVAITLVSAGFMLIGAGALTHSGIGYSIPMVLIFEGLVVADIAWWISGQRAAREAALQ